MKSQVISILLLFIISFQILPISSFFKDAQMEITNDASDDQLEKSEVKIKNIDSCHSLFFEYDLIPNFSKNIYINLVIGRISAGYSNSTFIPPNFS